MAHTIGQPDIPPGTLLLGSRGTKYRLADRRGEGGMAVVYRAEKMGTEEPVAVKLLKPTIVVNVRGDTMELFEVIRREEYDRFVDEYIASSSLEHLNIVKALDSGNHDGRPFIVFEYVAGPSAE